MGGGYLRYIVKYTPVRAKKGGFEYELLVQFSPFVSPKKFGKPRLCGASDDLEKLFDRDYEDVKNFFMQLKQIGLLRLQGFNTFLYSRYFAI